MILKHMQTPEITSKTAVKSRLQPKLSPMPGYINMSGGGISNN